jgi:ArsR family transcriptional regulator
MRAQIPSLIAENLEKVGGLRGIFANIPQRRRIVMASSIFHSLSDPVRLSILYALSATSLCVCVIKSIIKVPDSKLSYHLDNLKSAGLVTQQAEGRFIVYKITDLGRAALYACDTIQSRLEE